MPGYRGIRGIRQSPLFERRLGPVGIGVQAALREEAVEQNRLDFGTPQLGGSRPCDQIGPATRQRDSKSLVWLPFAGQHLLLKIPTTANQVVPPRAGEFAAVTGQPRFKKVCDCEIDIIAAEQDVVADCLALNSRDGASAIRAEFKQAEIRCTATDVDHQDVMRCVFTVR